MGHLEVYLVNKIKTVSKQQKALFLSVFISDLFAHMDICLLIILLCQASNRILWI